MVVLSCFVHLLHLSLLSSHRLFWGQVPILIAYGITLGAVESGQPKLRGGS